MSNSDKDLTPPKNSPAEATRRRNERLVALLKSIDSHCPEATPDRVIAAVYQATGGSAAGMEMVSEWCSTRSDGLPWLALQAKWKSISTATKNINGLEDLCDLVTASGHDPLEVLAATEPDFEPYDEIETNLESENTEETRPAPSALTKYSLKGRRAEIEQTAVDQVHVLGRLALSSQLTAIYGKPGIGKSLIALSLVVDAIKQGNITGDKVYYLDFDTDPSGLLEKLSIAEEYGLHLLSDGYLDFSRQKFLDSLDQMIEWRQAAGTVLILDTLKKFCSIMDKDRSSAFANRLRRFSKAGGAVVALAHVNKHPGADNRPVFAGTSDFVEDTDCSHLMYELGTDPDMQTKTVTFENFKSRGDVERMASYRYSLKQGQSYRERFESVCPVDEAEVSAVALRAALKKDSRTIKAIGLAIRGSVVFKMELLAAAGASAGASRRAVLDVLDRYCGPDAATGLWTYSVHERGGKRYHLTAEGQAFLDRD